MRESSRQLPVHAVTAIVIAAVFWTSMAVFVAVALWRERDQRLAGARQASAALVQVMEAHTTRTFQTVDLMLAGVVDTLNLGGVSRNDGRFRATMRARLVEVPYVRAIFVIGPDGRIIHDTDYPDTPDVSLADRGYFIRHRDDPGLIRSISTPLRSRSELGWFVAATRRIGREGRFEGVVVAAVQPDYFESLYRRMGLNQGLVIAMFHRDGQMVARYPPNDAEIGRSFADRELFTGQLPMRASGDYIGERNSSGVDQLVSFGTLEHEPLVVALVHDVKAILANWRTNVIVALAGLACLLALLAALVAMFIRQQAFRERARQRAVQRDKLEALGRLTGGTAHDFANLLGVVNTNLDLVSHYAAGDQRVLDAVTVGKRAVSSGTKLIDQMLSFAKGHSLNIATIDVNVLISSRAGLLRHAAGSGVTVSFELEEHLPDCRADESQLETALVNLIVNARDALQSRGTIVIRTGNGIDSESVQPGTRDGPARIVRVTVQDDGPGLSDKARKHLFEPFFTTKGDAGHGLGLSQIYGFMRQVGGDVRIDSAPGKGAAVHLDFPTPL